MTRITVDGQLRERLHALTQPAELCDEQGGVNRRLSNRSTALKLPRSLVGLVAAILICGCGTKMAYYGEIHRSARSVLPAAVQMEELFGDADHLITHYGFPNQKTNTWNTEVHFGQRYRLHMQVEVVVDYKNKQIRIVGEPEFYLFEIKQVRQLQGGRMSADIGKNFRFSEQEWKKVYESEGDFSQVGIHLNEEPVPDFDEYVNFYRRPRIPISLLGREEH